MGNDEVVLVDEKTGEQFKMPPGTPLTKTGAEANIGGSSIPYVQSKGDRADLIDKIKPDLIVEVIRLRLLGYDCRGGKWIRSTDPKILKSCLTEKGAWDITNLILSVSNQNTSISKLTNEEIRTRALNICKSAQYLMIKNYLDYNIIGVDQLEYYHNIIFNMVFIILKQPEGEGIRKLIAGTIQENRNIGNQETRGIAGVLGGLFGKR